jgi:Response regulators consisting of a CheY-like receiver domain and a winged-helix DNA-binding domain
MMPPENGENRLGSILVIDDEPQIRRVIRNALDDVADAIVEAASARLGLDLAAAGSPDLIILDLSLPDLDGLEVCRDLRTFTKVPILVLSARHSDRDKAGLLDAGADDYLTKPFSTLELRARVRALRRRAHQAEGETGKVVAGDLEISVARRSVHRAGIAVHLTPTEWGLLRALLTNRGRTMTHQQLFRSVWGNAEGDAQQYLRVYVGQLRRKLEADPVRPKFIRTEPAVGYRFELDE